ncbi:MAG TPA: preprotein translocase subunit SecA, partial [Aliiroseovarius sp.]|nr:preprotein translocase subunit SecA [Aliiroseovarius sp.]
NAKHHTNEAHIVAQAGRKGAITISTNMAGRGTDIVLGGNLEVELAALKEQGADEAAMEQARKAWEERHQQVLEAGGLHIIGTERHESRRVDNQLRGRSGRQGDAGSSRFYLSLEDPLMRIFASERVAGLMQKLGMEEGEAIEHPWVSRAIENAQRKVEGHNFDMRKQLLEYDDVANDQRKVIYQQRNELLVADDIADTIKAIRADVTNKLIDNFVPPQSVEEQWDVPGLEEALEAEFGLKLDVQGWLDADKELDEEGLRQKILEAMEAQAKEKEDSVGTDVIRQIEKAVTLQVLDNQWRDHLALMDQLRQGIHLRGYAQKNPKQEYKRESFELFGEMLERIKHEVITILCRVQVQSEEDVEAIEAQRRQQQHAGEMEFRHAEASAMQGSAEGGAEEPPPNTPTPYVREGRKIGRNEPCPCGSGKKYKQCHGKLK